MFYYTLVFCLISICPDGSATVVDFLVALTVCNTVMLMPDSKTGKLNVKHAQALEACLQVCMLCM